MKKIISKVGVLSLIIILIGGIITASAAVSEQAKLMQQNKDSLSNSNLLNSIPWQRKLLDNREKIIKNPLTTSFFSGNVYTTCGSVQKTSTISFGSFNEIDVDNNAQTGVNGKDIRVQYIIVPWLDFDSDIRFGLNFVVSVERIGDEIKNEYFEISASILNGDYVVGFQTPEQSQNEIPYLMQLSTFVYVALESNAVGVSFESSPYYEDDYQDKAVIFFSSLVTDNTKRTYEFLFEPAVSKKITIESTRSPNMFQYTFSQGYSTVLTGSYILEENGETSSTKITIDPLPQYASFTLGLTPFSASGGQVKYESDTTYNTNILIESDEMGTCKYALIEDLPTYFYAQWLPSKEDGFFHVDIQSKGTNFQLVDSLTDPTIDLNVQGIKNVDFTAFWNFTNPGDFAVIKNESFHINLDVIIDVWEARIDAEPTAKNIMVTWHTDVSGYLSYDTNWEPLTTLDLLIKGSDMGIRTQSELFKAQDFELEWTLWPPTEFTIQKQGDIDFHSIVIEIFIDGNWYHLWPWT